MVTVVTTMMTMATAAAAAGGQTNGVVWGRRQAAKAAEMGINRKWEQCGYNSNNFFIYENCYVGYFLYVPYSVPWLLAKF